MLTSEQVFDMLPTVVDLYDKLKLDDYRKELAEKYRGKNVDPMTYGIDAFKYILMNSGKVKEEIFGIVAIVDGKTVEEIKKQSFMRTVASLKAIFSDKESMDFFKQAMT